ncbi:MAG: host-nuclease inhibitor Gam family protein [Rhizobiaceae bacterium]
MSRSKIHGANLRVPQNADEAAAMIRRVGEANREAARIQLDLSDRTSSLKEEAENKARPLKDEAAALTEGLKMWAEANRLALTGGGKVKFADLGTGKILWRSRPAKVSLRGKLDDIVQRLKELGLQRFVRVSEEVNKEAMLAEKDVARSVAGVAIASEGEDFVVEPHETELSSPAAA